MLTRRWSYRSFVWLSAQTRGFLPGAPVRVVYRFKAAGETCLCAALLQVSGVPEGLPWALQLHVGCESGKEGRLPCEPISALSSMLCPSC